jgi:cytochrome b
MQRYIWDPFVRLFHWSLVIAFGVAFYTHASEWDRMLHVDAGYAAGALIIFRIVWGTLATGYANFKTFPPNFIKAAKYLYSVIKGNARHYFGHNPTGALVIYAMLGIGLIAVASGILVFEDGWIFSDTYIDAYKSIHHYATWGWLIMVGLHVSGVITESILHRDNLILAMITGCKRVCKIKPKKNRQTLQPKHEVAYQEIHESKH